MCMHVIDVVDLLSLDALEHTDKGLFRTSLTIGETGGNQNNKQNLPIAEYFAQPETTNYRFNPLYPGVSRVRLKPKCEALF